MMRVSVVVFCWSGADGHRHGHRARFPARAGARTPYQGWSHIVIVVPDLARLRPAPGSAAVTF